MRNDFGNRPYKVRFPYKSGKTGKQRRFLFKFKPALAKKWAKKYKYKVKKMKG